jgi:FkbM family methyltransferase
VDKFIRRRRSPVAPPSPADTRFDDLIGLLFPGGLDEPTTDRLRAVAGSPPFDAATVRRLLGAVDQQVAPTRFAVRFGPDDLDEVDVEGLVLLVDRADASVSVQIVADGAYEPHVAAALDRLVPEGGTVVDVGANVGYHTLRAAVRVGSAGRVLAVEANPENARLLAATIARNRLANVDLLPLALADRRGHLHFGSHVGSNGGVLPDDPTALVSGRGTVVPCIRLDELGLERCDVMKIDVEGAEALVVAGATTTIERCRPAIVMELSCEMTRRVSGVEPLEHLERLERLGYVVHLIDRATGGLVPVGSAAALLADWGHPLRIEDLALLPGGSGGVPPR